MASVLCKELINISETLQDLKEDLRVKSLKMHALKNDEVLCSREDISYLEGGWCALSNCVKLIGEAIGNDQDAFLRAQSNVAYGKGDLG